MGDEIDPQTAHWHLDKRVPLALIWAILGQTAAIIVAGTLIYSDVQTQRRDLARVESASQREVARLDGQIAQIAAASNQQAVQLARIDENLGAMRADIRRLVSIWERPAQ